MLFLLLKEYLKIYLDLPQLWYPINVIVWLLAFDFL